MERNLHSILKPRLSPHQHQPLKMQLLDTFWVGLYKMERYNDKGHTMLHSKILQKFGFGRVVL
uniref:Tetratricoredoxin n=1 Tax=Solanum tuberosum TaxID=4113 RepID=M1D4A3_SOLTU